MCPGREFDDAPEVHHGDAVGHVGDHGEIVRDEEVRESAVALQIAQQVDDLRLHTDIECGDRLVAHDEGRLDGQRACDTDALALPSGELVRIAIRVFRPQPDFVEQSRHALVGLSAAREIVHDQSFLDRRTDRHAWIERTVRILKDDLHPAAQLPERLAAQCTHVVAVK